MELKRMSKDTTKGAVEAYSIHMVFQRNKYIEEKPILSNLLLWIYLRNVLSVDSDSIALALDMCHLKHVFPFKFAFIHFELQKLVPFSVIRTWNEGLGCSPVGKVLAEKVGNLVACACTFSIQDAEAVGSEIRGYPGSHNEFKTILNSRERHPVSKAKKKMKLKFKNAYTWTQIIG